MIKTNSKNQIGNFAPYQNSLRLYDCVVEDLDALREDPLCFRLIGQQIASTVSICENMEEAFARPDRDQIVRFLVIARSSARETLGRYKRMKNWLDCESATARAELLEQIIASLTETISTFSKNRV